jgi:hypothetical protein
MKASLSIDELGPDFNHNFGPTRISRKRNHHSGKAKYHRVLTDRHANDLTILASIGKKQRNPKYRR